MLILFPLALSWLLLPVSWFIPQTTTFGLWTIAFPIFFLAPLPASAARRFHDIGKSGWFALPIVLICSVLIYDFWKDLQAGPDASYDLWGRNDIAEFGFHFLCLFMVGALLQTPRDAKNPYGPNPRPPRKVI